MKRSRQEAEALLDSLVRASRAAPSAEQAAQLERRLSPWLGAKVSTSRFIHWRAGAMTMLVAIGLGALAQYYGDATNTLARRQTHSWSPSPRASLDLRRPATGSKRAIVVPAAATFVAAAPPLAPEPLTPPSSSVPEVGAGPAFVPPEVPQSAPSSAATAPREPEVDFLRRAQASLAISPAEALAMAERHPSLYPRGILVQEREVIAIDALVRLGRRAEARERAAAFQAAFPRSAHASRLETLTEKR